MYFLGIHSYSNRWRRGLWLAALLDILIALEGVGAIIWLMQEPSTTDGRLFLHYSAEKWILILITTFFVTLTLAGLWALKYRHAWLEQQLNNLEQKSYGMTWMVMCTIILLTLSTLHIWLPANNAIHPYYEKAFPLLLYITISVAQVWAFSFLLMRQNIIKAGKQFIPSDQYRLKRPLRNIDKRLLAVLIGISFAYLIIQFESYQSIKKAVLIGDSWSYMFGAGLSLDDPAFYSERRPWAILLVFKLLGRSEAAIEVFQLALSVLAWLTLAWTWALLIKKPWINIPSFLIVLGFSLSPTVQVWNHAVLSESLSISLLVFVLALFIRLSMGWDWQAFLLSGFLIVLWMSIREANAYIGLIAAIVLLLIGALRKNLRVYWVHSFFFIAMFAVNSQLSAAYGLPRWALPLAEVITKRILPDQEFLNYFSENGMPVTPELMALSGRNANSDNYAIVNSTRMRKFSKWLFQDGRNVYARFLLSHPFYTVESPLEDMDTLLASDFFTGITIPNYTPALPELINEFLYPQKWFWLYLWISLFSSGMVFAANLRTKSASLWVIFTFLLLSIPHLYLIWHGDALDVERHAVIVNVQFHICIWLLVTGALDVILSNQQTKAA